MAASAARARIKAAARNRPALPRAAHTHGEVRHPKKGLLVLSKTHTPLC